MAAVDGVPSAAKLKREAALIAARLAQSGPEAGLWPCVTLMEIAMMFGWKWHTAYHHSSQDVLPEQDFYLGNTPCWKLPTIYRFAAGENRTGAVREIVWDPWGIVAPATPVPPRPQRPGRGRTRRAKTTR